MIGPAHIARAALRQVVDFALPPRCAGCGSVAAAPGAFCFDCWSKLDLLGPPCCERCALPFEYATMGEALCAGCIASPPDFDRLRAAVAYGELARTVALKLKYGRRPGMAVTMAGFMARHLEAFDEPLLCPVPLHRWRIWRRGYNQSALIAAALAKRNGLDHRPDLLLRTRATPPLKGMSPSERRLAVRGAFRVGERHRERVKGRNILIIDDVFTSGATANACARVLRKAGAGQIGVLCWARVVRGHDH
ncbi:MAG TPA: ComF family protein [Allosphingosinicella sp.]|jgi:ComF family protein